MKDMGTTPLERLIAWFFRPRPCRECGRTVAYGEDCTDYCEELLADVNIR